MLFSANLQSPRLLRIIPPQKGFAVHLGRPIGGTLLAPADNKLAVKYTSTGGLTSSIFSSLRCGKTAQSGAAHRIFLDHLDLASRRKIPSGNIYIQHDGYEGTTVWFK